ncbi:Re/Si-specific NAD(P)(+) transhydrogenase subunit alpha [candidate division KSB1 bacterium]|nr:Re/Si-specific NAD(P)(+) transhydrogenase subunit alpha [candidate division KSB1 bacterium]RQW04961.1 MAG: Re/Si-specific NAD(P)(+) transhydrogenase subunit alpha [candidate division KSB1 bacterium]
MRIAVPREIDADEQRVALVPSEMTKLVKSAHSVIIEAGAGSGSGYTDEEYRQAGADIRRSPAELYKDADVVFKVRPPKEDEIRQLRKGAVLICFLEVLREPGIAQKLADQGVTAVALEMVPRISRAQSMDALSSQASAAGYKAMLIGAEAIRKYFPMLTTAAGTIRPARVFVLGAGVAGLQAIATARRLGALVEAFDIRAAAKGEVESLGAKFVDIDLGESGEAEGGYAKEISEKAKEREHALIKEVIARSDVVVTTAAVPGKKAPVLVTEDMVAAMKTGSVIVDMAVEQGGNVAGSQAGKKVMVNGVAIIAPVNLPSQMAIHTSQLLARNLVTLFMHLAHDGKLELDFKDEITAGAVITHGGEIVHERTKELVHDDKTERKNHA